MAPIVKFSKEKILEIGLKIIGERGIEDISARNIAKELGCSICPIFSCFENMEILKEELLRKIHEFYSKYIEEGMKNNDKPFKGAGLAYIKFSKDHSNYFKALFMGKVGGNLEELLKMDLNNEKIANVICESTGISKENAIKLHKYNWVFVHGIAVMVATDYCNFSEEEIDEMLTTEYNSLLSKFKGDGK